MSIRVDVSKLGEALARHDFAYLLTNSAQGAPRALAVRAVLHDGVLRIDGTGERTWANVQARPAVGLVWPPLDADGYSLIVDGDATVVDGQIRIAPTHAVLHRPAPKN